MACSDPDCPRRVKAYGLCENHYKRYQRGTYEPVRPLVARKQHTDAERAARYIPDRGPGCWLWTGAVDQKGYGVVRVDGRLLRAHRWFYAYSTGQSIDDVDLDHTCHNESQCHGHVCVHRRCVRPDHLEPVDRSTNLRRGRSGGWNGRTTCKRGHDVTDPGNVGRKSNGVRYCLTCAVLRRRS